MEFLIGLAIYIALCMLVGKFAADKGRHGFFLLSFLISPLFGFLVALLVSPNDAAAAERRIAQGTSKQCPHCAEIIRLEAAVCRYCGRDVPAGIVIDHPSASPKTSIGTIAMAALCVCGVAYVAWIFFPAEPATSAQSETLSPIAPEAPALESASDPKARAIARFPQLGVAGSPMNRDFLARVARYKSTHPDVFKDPAWPLMIAEESDRAVRAATAQR